MRTQTKVVRKTPTVYTYEVCEVLEIDGKKCLDLIGYLVEAVHGVEWEHPKTLRRSGSIFPRRDQALRALKSVHQAHKNGLTLKTL